MISTHIALQQKYSKLKQRGIDDDDLESYCESTQILLAFDAEVKKVKDQSKIRVIQF